MSKIKIFGILGLGLIIITTILLLLFVPKKEQMVINALLKIRESDESNSTGRIIVQNVYVCNENFAKIKAYAELEDKTLSKSTTIYIYQDRIVNEVYEQEEICLSEEEYNERPQITPIDEDDSASYSIRLEWSEEEYIVCINKNKEIKSERELIKSKIESVDLTCKQESEKISKLGLYRINKRIN